MTSLYLKVVKLVAPEDILPAPVRPIAPVLPPFFFIVPALVPITVWSVRFFSSPRVCFISTRW